jgi:hypothetical protein
MPRSSRLLCAFFALIAFVALLGTWSQNIAYFDSASPGDTLHAFARFLLDTKANPASRSITIDLSLFLLAASVLMIVEARRLGVRFVGAYILFGFLVAISVTFPLFLIARERRLAAGGVRSDAEKILTVSDVVGIALVTIVVGALVWYLRS